MPVGIPKWRPEFGPHAPWRRRPQPKPKHPKWVMVEWIDGQGRRHLRRMGYAAAAQRMQVSKNMDALQAEGRAHRWTSEEASKARRKGNKRRYGTLHKRIGVRVGQKLHRRPRLNLALLRAYYQTHPTKGVKYQGAYVKETEKGDRTVQVWIRTTQSGTQVLHRQISEHAALTRLGYYAHSRPRTFVPDRIIHRGY